MPYRSYFVGKTEGIEVVDEYTLRVRNKAFDVEFMDRMPNIGVISPSALRRGVDLRRAPVGSGPYKFVSYRNAVLPQLTALALSLGGIAGGTVIVEYIFTYPGMGYLLYTGIVNGDYAIIQGVVFFLVVGVATAVLIIDLLYPLIDPRITYQRR